MFHCPLLICGIDYRCSKYYDELPDNTDDYVRTITGIDLAISQKTNADYTAMVTAHVFGSEGDMRVYILPNPINKRIDFPTTVDYIERLSHENYFNGRRTEIHIEQVAYQTSILQQMEKIGVHVEGFKVDGKDKRERLASVSPMIMQGRVLFPKEGAELLIQQLLYFGVEKHDDLVDALTMVLFIALKKDRHKVKVYGREVYDAIAGWSRDYGSSRSAYW